MSEMKTRILSSLVLFPLGLIVIYIGGWTLSIFALVIIGLISFEAWSFSLPNESLEKILRLVAISLFPSIGYIVSGYSGLLGMLLVSVVFLLLLTVLEIERGEYLDNLSEQVPLRLALFLYVSGFGTSLFVLANNSVPADYFIWLLIVVVSTDTAAYFGGRKFGVNKLSPRISPGKTREGAIAGALCAVVFSVLSLYVLNLPFGILLAIFYAFLASMLSQLGDLFESMFKRAYDVKDSGSIIPGHGGVLDRLDGFLVAQLILYFFPSI